MVACLCTLSTFYFFFPRLSDLVCLFQGRETALRDTSESTYERVFYWSLLQIAIVILSAFIQTRYLKRFFMQKKQH